MKRLVSKYQRTWKNLIKAWHDVENRDFAICYLDGEIVEGNTHSEAIDIYLQEKYNQVLKTTDIVMRPPLHVSEDLLNEDDKELMEQIRDNIKQIGFAHVVEDENAIYVEDDSLLNVDINTVAQAIKAKYPNYDVYDDKAFDEHEHKKVAKKK